MLAGLAAVPRGLWFLATTRGVKRWLVPPLLLTSAALVLSLVWVFGALDSFLSARLPQEVALDRTLPCAWLERLAERWGWLETSWSGLVASLEWVLNSLWDLGSSRPLKWLVWFLVGSLVAWYCFSIAYEALAGPFLDEVQGRIEGRWFGADPRNRLQRPTDIPSERCARLTIVSAALASALLVGLVLLTPLPIWAVLPLAALGIVPALLYDARFGTWCLWVARLEGRALWVSLQASAITGVLLVLALPLYFVPAVGYFLFAAATGFATAVGLLDIPFERRGWALPQRLRFVARNLPALCTFGAAAGLLLAVPVVGPVLMVPSASIGGLWLVCRIDKSHLRRAAQAASPLKSGGG
jgi:uncharacterized protein involved in cysteine biosynthesis